MAIRSGVTPACPFPILLIGHTLSKIGDGLHELIFVITVLKATNNAIAPMATIYFLRFLPFLAVGPLGAALADRIAVKRLMLLADPVRMLLTASFSTLLIADQVGTFALALFGMSMTAMRTLFQPAFQAVSPLLVAPERLSRANGATQIAHELGGLLGPALGGALLALTWRSGAVLLLDSATYLLSAACLMAIHIPIPNGASPQRGPSGGVQLRDLYKQFGHNLTQLAHHPQLLVTIAYSSACILFAGAALRMLIPAMIKQSAGPDSTIGYAMSLSALGTIVGVMLYGRLARPIGAASLMAYWALYGTALALLPLCVSNPTALLCGCFMLGVAGAFVDVAIPGNIQRFSGSDNIGRNFGLFGTLANTGEALSGPMSGVLTLFFSTGASITLIGLSVTAMALLGRKKLSAMVRRQKMPEELLSRKNQPNS